MNAGPPSDGLTLLGVFHSNSGMGKQSAALAPEELMWKWGRGDAFSGYNGLTHYTYICKSVVPVWPSGKALGW